MPLGVSSSQGRCWKSVYYIKVLQSYKKAIPTLTLCAKNHLYPIIFCVEPAGKFQFSSPCVSDRPTCLTFFCSKMSKNAQWINKEYCFFIRQTEVQPDFAIAMSVPTECRAMKAGSQKLCWGTAWLRECKDTTCTPRNPNFFGIWYRTPTFFFLEKRPCPLYLRAFRSIFRAQKKWNRDILLQFVSHANRHKKTLTSR